jgi:hypothetical protein
VARYGGSRGPADAAATVKPYRWRRSGQARGTVERRRRCRERQRRRASGGERWTTAGGSDSWKEKTYPGITGGREGERGCREDNIFFFLFSERVLLQWKFTVI